MSEQDNKNLVSNNSNDTNKGDAASTQRRKAVKNILAGSGVVAGAAATSNQWVKPAVNAVVTPAHAQTSGPITLNGNAALSGGPVMGAGSGINVLDLFIDSAIADQDPASLDGACLTMTLDFLNSTIDLLVEYAFNDPVMLQGTISGNNISGNNGSVSFSGTADSAARTASGSISNGVTAYSFNLNDNQQSCEPRPPVDETTTTIAATTGLPTTGDTTSTTPFESTSTPYPTSTTPFTTTPFTTTPFTTTPFTTTPFFTTPEPE